MVHQGRTYDYAIVIRTVTVYTWTIINCVIRTISTNSIEPTIGFKVGSIPNNNYAHLTYVIKDGTYGRKRLQTSIALIMIPILNMMNGMD